MKVIIEEGYVAAQYVYFLSIFKCGRDGGSEQVFSGQAETFKGALEHALKVVTKQALVNRN